MAKRVDTGRLFITAAEESVGQMSEDKQLEIKKSTRIRFGYDGTIQVGNVNVTNIGFDITETEMTEVEFGELGIVITRLDSALQWILGDWINYGNVHEWGDKFKKVIEQTGRPYNTITKYKSVALKIPFCRRRQNLSYTHHVLVASADVTDEVRWQLLQQAEEEQWGLSALKLAIARKEGRVKPTSETVIANKENRLRQSIKRKAKKDFDRWYAVAREQREAWSALIDELENFRPFC